MDSKRPDVRLDDAPDEDGLVTKQGRGTRSVRSVIDRLRKYFNR
ncbi:hypothetical protein [Natrinema sp. SYSU A 869]|nr:hypothetical protein [Natrinema sp. SYSU A 869]